MASNIGTDDRIIIFAPGIHTGGGIALLKAILSTKTIHERAAILILDGRCLPYVTLPETAMLLEISPSIIGRLRAEYQLRNVSLDSDTIICLHSLPPLFRLHGRTVCFLQNILHLGVFPLSEFPLKTRLRLYVETLLGRLLRRRVDTYIVQTKTMQRCLEKLITTQQNIIVCPFLPDIQNIDCANQPDKQFDFIFVADGQPHKNHKCLLAAWRILAEKGIYPKLSLTLTSRDHKLIELIDRMRSEHSLNIENLGALSQADIIQLYRSARALIFPSFAESLGLPLLEASQLGLPILAPELDYVRDVCQPSETFDPASPGSIARAVQRFLGLYEHDQKLYTADTFIKTAIEQDAIKPVEDES